MAVGRMGSDESINWGAEVPDTLEGGRPCYYCMRLANLIRPGAGEGLSVEVESIIFLENSSGPPLFYSYCTKLLIYVQDEFIEVDDPKTRKREINGLIKAAKETGCKELAILTWDYESQEDSDPPIKFQPVWKWLLEQGE